MYAGGSITIASHDAQIIQGTYVDQRRITIIVPPKADPAWLKQFFGAFGLPLRPTTENARFAKLEEKLNIAAARLEAVETDVRRGTASFPRDLDSLFALRAEIEARIAETQGALLIGNDWLGHAPFQRAKIVGFRLQRTRYGVTPERPPAIASRFSDGQFAVLYVGMDPTAALFESRGFLHPSNQWLHDYQFVSVEIEFQRLLHLGDDKTRACVEHYAPGLLRALVARGSWTTSQYFGRQLLLAGFDGCIFPSAISVGRENIVIFPSNLDEDEIRILDVSPVCA